jgi:hypothetical protein
MAEAAHGATRNMVALTNTEAYEYAERGEARAAGCMAVTVCGIGIAACVLLGLLLAGPCRRAPQPGPESLAANIAAGIYGDELADCGGH